MLKAKLAYAVGRDASSYKGVVKYKTKIKDFYEELEIGINSIRPGNNGDLVRFVKLIESIVAYHKFYGGK
jgi:CRISPR-associated protein Csm2